MLSFVMTMFLACGDKDEDTAVEATEPATEETAAEPSTEDTSTSDTGTEEQPEDTGTETPADTGSAE